MSGCDMLLYPLWLDRIANELIIAVSAKSSLQEWKQTQGPIRGYDSCCSSMTSSQKTTQ